MANNSSLGGFLQAFHTALDQDPGLKVYSSQALVPNGAPDVVELPEGTWTLKSDDRYSLAGFLAAGRIPISGHFWLMGKGHDKTTLLVDETVFYALKLFSIAAGSSNKVKFGGITIQGPATVTLANGAPPNPDGSDALDLYGIYAEGNLCEVTLEDVKCDGFNYGLYSDDSAAGGGINKGSIIKSRDVELYGKKGGVFISAGNNAQTFWDHDGGKIGLAQGTLGVDYYSDVDAHWKGIYLERSVGYNFRNTEITFANKYGFWQDTGDNYSYRGAMARVAGCRFGPLLNVGLYASPACGTVVSEGNAYHSTLGISKGHGRTVSVGDKFFGYGGTGYAIANDDGYDGPVDMSDFYIGMGDPTNAAGSRGYLAGILREQLLSTAVDPINGAADPTSDEPWRFRNGYIDDCAKTGGSGIRIDGGHVQLDRVTTRIFTGSEAVVSHGHGRFVARGCRNEGTKQWLFQSDTGTSEITIEGQRDANFANGPTFDASSGNRMTVRGRDNLFPNGMTVAAGGANIKGYMDVAQGVSNQQATAWAPLTAYVAGNIRRNNGFLYECITNGTSAASGGPGSDFTVDPTTHVVDPKTALEPNIVDGTAHWKYVDEARDFYSFSAGAVNFRWRTNLIIWDEVAATITDLNADTFAAPANNANVLFGGTVGIYFKQAATIAGGGNCEASLQAAYAAGSFVKFTKNPDTGNMMRAY